MNEALRRKPRADHRIEQGDDEVEQGRVQDEGRLPEEPSRVVTGGAQVRKEAAVNGGEVQVADRVPARERLGGEQVRDLEAHEQEGCRVRRGGQHAPAEAIARLHGSHYGRPRAAVKRKRRRFVDPAAPREVRIWVRWQSLFR